MFTGHTFYLFAELCTLDLKVLPVECFLEKASTGRSRSSSRGSSPGRSPVQYVDEPIQGFKVNLKPEKKSKFSSVVLKIRGIDQVAATITYLFYLYAVQTNMQKCSIEQLGNY